MTLGINLDAVCRGESRYKARKPWQANRESISYRPTEFHFCLRSTATSATMEAKPFILVTGANGFLGTWIVSQLLKKGYRVRAAVRILDRGAYLRELFKAYSDSLEIVVVGNMTEVR
jgi:hypothetical protein